MMGRLLIAVLLALSAGCVSVESMPDMWRAPGASCPSCVPQIVPPTDVDGGAAD